MSQSLKNISVVAVATVVSRVLGLVREIFIAAAFGASALSSAFVTAFTLPNLFRRLLGEGALTAAFVPTLSHELEHRQRTAAFGLVSKVTSWLAVVTMTLVVVAMLAGANAAALLRLMGGLGLEEDTTARFLMAADLAVMLFPYMAFVCLAAAFSAACQVLGRFSEPAWSPVWLNLTIILSLVAGSRWAWGDSARMNLLCGGILLGGFLQMIVPAVVLWREGWRPALDLRLDERVREIMRLMGPTVIGSAIYLINMAVSRIIGLSLNDQANTVLNLSTRVMELPVGIFTVAIATVIFPLIARHAANGDWAKLGEHYHKGLRLVLLINIPAGVGLALLSGPVTRLLFQRGEFTSADSALMAPVLAVYALGLPFLSFTTVALRGFYALKDTATPVRAAALSFVVNLVMSLVLMRWFSTMGLALAGNLAVFAQAWYLQVKLGAKQPGLGFGPVWGSLGKILLASTVLGIVLWIGLWFSAGISWPSRVHDLVVICSFIPAGIGVYGGLLWLMRIEGRDELGLILEKLRGKLGG